MQHEITVVCEDPEIKEEIETAVAVDDWDRVAEMVEWGFDLGTPAIVSSPVKIQAKARSRKTILRDEARRRRRTSTRKEKAPEIEKISRGLAEQLLDNPIAKAVVEKTAKIQAEAFRREAAEQPDRKDVLLSWATELDKGKPFTDLYVLRGILYPQKVPPVKMVKVGGKHHSFER